MLVHVHMWTCGSQRTISGVIPQWPNTLKDRTSQGWNYKPMPLHSTFPRVLGTKLSSLCLQGKRLTDRAIPRPTTAFGAIESRARPILQMHPWEERRAGVWEAKQERELQLSLPLSGCPLGWERFPWIQLWDYLPLPRQISIWCSSSQLSISSCPAS